MGGESPLTIRSGGLAVESDHWACSNGRWFPLGVWNSIGDGLRERPILIVWKREENRKGHFRRNAPTLPSYHSIHSMSIIDCIKWGFLRFIPFLRKLFVGNPVLKKVLRHGRLMVRKKVIPDMVSTPAGWAFHFFRFT